MNAGPGVDQLRSCRLPLAWANQSAWTILDCGFLDGQTFLQVWQAWQIDPQRPRMLHYVGICSQAPSAFASAHLQTLGDQPSLARILADQCNDLDLGFHRMVFDNARVSLTLCIGDVHTMLGEQVFQADTLFATEPADKWEAQLLARRCKRGARFSLLQMPRGVVNTSVPDTRLSALMQAVGFQLDDHASGPMHAAEVTGAFNPAWKIPDSRRPSRAAVQPPTRCAVIGAGLSGASVAHALALRGWQVTVFDQESTPASGASGLPAGLAVPHVSTDNSPRSRLSRVGIRLVVQHAQRLLVRGQDWELSGVLERKANVAPRSHAHAAWIKPVMLVQAWLAHPGVTFAGQKQVCGLDRIDGRWLLSDTFGHGLGHFELVVIANAMGCAALLKHANPELFPNAAARQELQDKLAALQAVHGTLSHGTYAEEIPDLPSIPVNGNGCFIPHVPGTGGEQWFAGSTFEPDALAAADVWAQHAANMERLQHLLPETGHSLAETLDRGPVAQWSATRCVTHDRLPLVGPISTDSDAGLWLCVGMGSRGLSFSALCAELLAARLGAEPLPVEFSLSRSLDVNRVRRKRVFSNSGMSLKRVLFGALCFLT